MARVFVGNISRHSRTSDVERLFGKYGDIRSLRIKSDFAFIEYDYYKDA